MSEMGEKDSHPERELRSREPLKVQEKGKEEEDG